MKKRKTIIKIAINLGELIVLVVLILVIIYLIKSENGIQGKLDEKNAGEKLQTAINNFTSSEDERDLEEYIREIEGAEEIEVNREAGTIELKINGRGFLVVVRRNKSRMDR